MLPDFPVREEQVQAVRPPPPAQGLGAAWAAPRLIWATQGRVEHLGTPAWVERREGVYSQQIFQLTADKQRAVLQLRRDDGSEAVQVLDASGERYVVSNRLATDLRFSPNGRYLALAIDSEVQLFDLSVRRTMWTWRGQAPRWVEWTQGGLAVLDGADAPDLQPTVDDRIVVLGPAGQEMRAIAPSSGVSRLVAAPSTTRLVWFSPPNAGGTSSFWLTDWREPTPTRRWGFASGGDVFNAELAHDGSEVAFVTAWGVFRYDGSGPLAEVLFDVPTGHSLWYRPDGSLVWATPGSLHRRYGGQVDSKPVAGVSAMRLAKDPASLVYARGRTLYRWDTYSGRSTEIGQAGRGRKILSGDEFGAGALLWTAGPGRGGHRRDRRGEWR